MVKKPTKKQRSKKNQETKLRSKFRKNWGRKFRSKPPHGSFSKWSRNPATDTKKSHTFYVTIEVEVGQSGTPPFAKMGDIVPVTLALLKRQKDGKLTKLTYTQLAKNFDELVEQALSRANFTPAKEIKQSIRGIFRHRSK